MKDSQILLLVRPASVQMSANGKMSFQGQEWQQLFQAVTEARAEILRRRTDGG